MPWMVLMFGILVVPLGGISIFFIIIQPIVIGTWCTLCLIAALAMLIMIPYALDELVAMGQFLADAKRKGKPLSRTFWMGGAMDGGSEDGFPGFQESWREMAREAVAGTTLPWTLVLSTFIGLWLMFTRVAFGTNGSMADSDHLLGSLVVTFSIIAMAEVGRQTRFINIAFGAWLIAAPWVLQGAGSSAAVWNSIGCGAALIVLSIKKGKIECSYAGWNKYIF